MSDEMIEIHLLLCSSGITSLTHKRQSPRLSAAKRMNAFTIRIIIFYFF